MHVYNCIRIFIGECVFQLPHTDSLMRSEMITEYPGSCSLWTRYTGDSKTDKRYDSEIRTGSYSANPMVIRIRNCLISSEYLLLHYCSLILSSVYLLSCSDIGYEKSPRGGVNR